MPTEVAAGHWNYKSSSSGAAQAISSLKQFGLLLEDSEGGSRQVRLSPEALTILLHDPEAPERLQAIKTAALAPKIHTELWEKYKGRLGSDSAIRIYLTLNREQGVFNKDSVDDFIKQFRDTIAFAKLSVSDKLNVESGEQTENDEHQPATGGGLDFDAIFGVGKGVFGDPSKPPPLTLPSAAKKMRDLAIPLMDDEVAFLRVPAPLSEENYEYLLAQLAMFKMGLVPRKAKSSSPAAELATPATGADDAGPNAAQVPFMITSSMRSRLNALGHDDAAIRNMTPRAAWAILNEAE